MRARGGPPRGQPGGPPQPPEHLLRAGPLPVRRPDQPEQLATRRSGAVSLAGSVGSGRPRRTPGAQRVDQQVITGAVLLGGRVQPQQPAPQPTQPQRVSRAQRGAEQRHRRVRVNLLGAGRTAQQQQQRQHRRLPGQRQFVRRHGHRHPSGQQRPPQHWQRTRGGPHQHGHLRPRHSVGEVRAAQPVSHPNPPPGPPRRTAAPTRRPPQLAHSNPARPNPARSNRRWFRLIRRRAAPAPGSRSASRPVAARSAGAAR